MAFHALILAGGRGTRFWPLSREKKPKQFLDILDTGQSLLESTLQRVRPLQPKLWIIGAQEHKTLLEPYHTQAHILLEPIAKNTAPAILYALLQIHRQDPEAIVLCLPADHYIPDEKIFQDQVLHTLQKCPLDRAIYTFGIPPTYPHTGYGYIQYAPSAAEQFCYSVRTFTEKPSRELATKFVESGEFLWNSGMFLFSAQVGLKAYQTYAPELYELFLPLVENPQELHERYQQAHAISFDHAIMEKYPSVAVVKGRFRWWDLGSWNALASLLPHDNQDNATCHTECLFLHAQNNLVVGSQPHKILVLMGVENLIVVDTPDALLITHKSQEQEIRHIVQNLTYNRKEIYL
ncbi:MAG: mannose-1-phosphate guanylyltransferase [Bacteroidia bacterium]